MFVHVEHVSEGLKTRAQWQPGSSQTACLLGDIKSQFNMVRKSAVHRVNMSELCKRNPKQQWMWIDQIIPEKMKQFEGQWIFQIRQTNPQSTWIDPWNSDALTRTTSRTWSEWQDMVATTINYLFLGWVPQKSTLCCGNKFWNKWKTEKSNLSDLQVSGTSGLWTTTTRPNRWSMCRTLRHCRKYGEMGKSGPWVSKDLQRSPKFGSLHSQLSQLSKDSRDPIFAS